MCVPTFQFSDLLVVQKEKRQKKRNNLWKDIETEGK